MTDSFTQPVTADDRLYLQRHIPAQASIDEPEEALDLGRIARSLARNWWIILGATLLSTAAAGLKVLSEPPAYTGRFEVLVQPGSAETAVIANIPETLSSDSLPRQIAVDEDLLKILKSPKVLTPVVEKVKVQFPDLCQVPATDENSKAVVDSYCYEAITRPLSVQALDDALDDNSTIVQATFQNEDPQVVGFILSELSQAYLAYSLETKQSDISRGIDFVDQKLPDLREKVDVLQSRLQDLRLKNDIIDPFTRASQLAEQVGTFSQEQRELEVQLQQSRATSDDLRQQSQQPQQQASSAALNDNPRYQTLLNTLLELDAEIAASSTIYLETAPEMEVLQEQRQNLLSLLATEGEQSQREVTSQIRQLQAREQAISQTIQNLNAEVDQLTGVARSYDEIQRELSITTENLNQFTAKREALEIDAAQREIPWEIVTPPTLPQPIASSLLRYLLLGGTLGLLLGVGLALLADESSGVIYSEEDIKRATRLPVLASIPVYDPRLDRELSQQAPVPSKEYAVVTGNAAGQAARSVASNGTRNGASRSADYKKNHFKPYSKDPFSESFHSLYTNLRLLNTQGKLHSIAISSVMPSEGKSTVAIHLAETAAATGKRVLLVDADLRNPQLHNYLHLSNEKGLTNLFSGEANPAVIQKYSPDSNLYVLTTGSVSFEPNRLFSSRSMDQFVSRISTKFDLVIYDTPPLLGQSDAYLISNSADGLLLVAKPGTLKQSALDRAMEQLRTANINLLGVVVRER